MRDLSVQAANTGSQDANAVAAAQTEFNNLKAEINRIGNTTSFGNTKLLDGSFGSRYQTSSVAAAFANKTVTAADDTATVTVAGLPSFNVDLNEALDLGAGAGVLNSAQGVVDEVNRALRAGLVASGGTGDEVQMTYSTADNGDVTYTLVGSAAFTIAANGGENAFNTHFGIAAATYNTTSGTGGVFQVGANNSANDRLSVAIGQVNASQLNVSAVDLTTTAGAQAAITTISNAISSVSTTRA
jgi:flagellin